MATKYGLFHYKHQFIEVAVASRREVLQSLLLVTLLEYIGVPLQCYRPPLPMTGWHFAWNNQWLNVILINLYTSYCKTGNVKVVVLNFSFKIRFKYLNKSTLHKVANVWNKDTNKKSKLNLQFQKKNTIFWSNFVLET